MKPPPKRWCAGRGAMSGRSSSAPGGLKAPIVYNADQTFRNRQGHRRWWKAATSPSSPTACWWRRPLLAAETLEGEGISARVIDMHTVKPLDRDAIQQAAAETGAIVVAEEHLVDCGMGVRVAQVVAETHPCPMEFVGIQDTYAESGQPEELLEKYGLVARDVTSGGAQSPGAKALIRRMTDTRRPRRSLPGAEPGLSLDRRPHPGLRSGLRRSLAVAAASPRRNCAAARLQKPSARAIARTWMERFARAFTGETLPLSESAGSQRWNISRLSHPHGGPDRLCRRAGAGDQRLEQRRTGTAPHRSGRPEGPGIRAQHSFRASCTMRWARTSPPWACSST